MQCIQRSPIIPCSRSQAAPLPIVFLLSNPGRVLVFFSSGNCSCLPASFLLILPLELMKQGPCFLPYSLQLSRVEMAVYFPNQTLTYKHFEIKRQLSSSSSSSISLFLLFDLFVYLLHMCVRACVCASMCSCVFQCSHSIPCCMCAIKGLLQELFTPSTVLVLGIKLRSSFLVANSFAI